jgi:TRAP-type C4-dicarboxylate transport system substrate-binding protein
MNEKRFLRVIGATWIALFILSVVVFPSYASQPNVIKLKAATYFSPTQPLGEGFNLFFDKVMKRSKGQVEIQTFMGSSLLGPKDIYDGVVQGTVDIGLTMPGYNTGKFPEMELVEMPHGYVSAFVSSHVANDYFNQFNPKEYSQTKMLYWFASPPSVIICNKPVRTLADLKGLKIRGTARVGEIVSALGEVYTSISKNVMDGIMWPISTLDEWKLAELKPKILNSWQIGAVFAFYTVMNKNTWEKLPANIQTIFKEAAEEMITEHAALYDGSDLKGYEMGKSAAAELFNFSKQDTDKAIQLIKPVTDKWVSGMVAKGFDGNEMKKRPQFLWDRSKYWSAKQKELGIKAIPGRID